MPDVIRLVELGALLRVGIHLLSYSPGHVNRAHLHLQETQHASWCAQHSHRASHVTANILRGSAQVVQARDPGVLKR